VHSLAGEAALDVLAARPAIAGGEDGFVSQRPYPAEPG